MTVNITCVMSDRSLYVLFNKIEHEVSLLLLDGVCDLALQFRFVYDAREVSKDDEFIADNNVRSCLLNRTEVCCLLLLTCC